MPVLARSRPPLPALARRLLVSVTLVGVGAATAAVALAAPTPRPPPPTPEATQDRASLSDVASGRYGMEIDEFGSGAAIGAGRIIDVNDITKPFVVSELRVDVNQADAQDPDLEADPGNSNAFQGYQAHSCSLPSRVDPQVPTTARPVTSGISTATAASTWCA